MIMKKIVSIFKLWTVGNDDNKWWWKKLASISKLRATGNDDNKWW